VEGTKGDEQGQLILGGAVLQVGDDRKLWNAQHSLRHFKNLQTEKINI
jgi:hypothetical protein